MPGPRLRILLAVTVALAAIGATLLLTGVAAKPDGRTTVAELAFGGVDHQYRLFMPSSFKNASKPGVLVVLHGYTWDARSFEEYTGLDAEAAGQGLLAVYPQGFDRSWNAGTCCGEALRRGLD